MNHSHNALTLTGVAQAASPWTSSTFTTRNASRGLLVVDVTAITGTSVTLKVQGVSASGVSYDLPSGATSALTATGTVVVSLASLPKRVKVVATGVSITTLTLTADLETID